jgi:hypothetical protein
MVRGNDERIVEHSLLPELRHEAGNVYAAPSAVLNKTGELSAGRGPSGKGEVLLCRL